MSLRDSSVSSVSTCEGVRARVCAVVQSGPICTELAKAECLDGPVCGLSAVVCCKVVHRAAAGRVAVPPAAALAALAQLTCLLCTPLLPFSLWRSREILM